MGASAQHAGALTKPKSAECEQVVAVEIGDANDHVSRVARPNETVVV
jgi:hypothetical protein